MGGQSNCSACELSGARLCQALRRAQPGSQGNGGAVRRLRRDEMIYEVGTRPGLIGILRKGYLRRERLTQDGRRTVLGLVLPGGVVGELAERTAGYSLEAATAAEICLFPQPFAKRRGAEDADFWRVMMADVQRQYSDELTFSWLRCGLRCRERVIAFLMLAADLLPTEPEPDGSMSISIPIVRKDWADLCNTTVESISRQLADLASEGLIDFLGGRRYRLRNLNALHSLAGLSRGFSPLAPARVRMAG